MSIGKLEPFDLSSKQWPAYVRRVQQFIILNEIKPQLRVSLLITVVGDATYSLMCDLCSPALPEEKAFDELVRLVSEHLEPQRSEIAERHVFRLRRQEVGEPLADYLKALKHLATTCNFRDALEENLRDQFVSGLASEAMRSRIFAERSIRYKEAVELAFALEAAERHAGVSGVTGSTATFGAGSGGEVAADGLHRVSARRGRGRDVRPSGGVADYGCSEGGAERGDGADAGAGECWREPGGTERCWRCGRPHRADRCRFSQYNCDECGRRGHIKVMCKELRERRRLNGSRQHFVSDASSDEDFFNINVMSKDDDSFILPLYVDGQKLDFALDTGSRLSTISEQCYGLWFSHKRIMRDNVTLRSYDGSLIKTLGFISVFVALGGVKAFKIPLYIIRNGGRPILGRDWLRTLNINQISFPRNNVNNNRFVKRPAVECNVDSNRLQLSAGRPRAVRTRPGPLAFRSWSARMF
ncbi:uncharacterized protein LOC123722216 [Papilio machaon]|uniref:uncharacterized protein LOC123722216 n=1 Tax=Papilio machaon TaxID=76193 RepID=UPI001E662D1E|nr:uncharacterized protein LOC123722216 [Papilio machaon]